MSAEQDRSMKTVLARLELVSCGTIYSYTPIGSGGAFGSGEPRSGDSHPPHVWFAGRYNGCDSDHARGRVIVAAQEALAALTRRTAPKLAGETVKQRDTRMLREGESMDARTVANAFRVNIKDVWRVRREGGRDKDHGRRLPELVRLDTAERRRRVQQLRVHHPGMTVRQIALHVGASPTTVAADLATLDEAA